MINNYEYHAIGSYKSNLFDLIIKDELSEYLIDLLMPNLEDNRFDKIDNFLGGTFTYNNADGSSELVKLKGHLSDVPFVYTTISDTRNVICMDTNIVKSSPSTKEMLVELFIMCNKTSLALDSSVKLKYRNLGYIGKNRLDIAVALLGDIINNSLKFGIGKLTPTPSNPVSSYYPNNDYFGKILRYTCSDFMIDYTG